MIHTDTELKPLYVAGRFDDEGGRPSKIAALLSGSIGFEGVEIRNGGSFRELEQILDGSSSHNPIFWFADVPTVAG